MSSRPDLEVHANQWAPLPTTAPALRSFILEGIDASLMRPFLSDVQRKVIGATRTVVATDDATVVKILEALSKE